MTQLHHRAAKRFPTQLVVAIKTPQHQASYGETRDISAGGIYFSTATNLAEMESLRLVLPLPPELRDDGRAWVICHADVVRVDKQEDGRLGVGAAIKRYEVLTELPELGR
jgi:c-di-GMP-binding flagellar brake protein YcgR